jgi:hypothetical protein
MKRILLFFLAIIFLWNMQSLISGCAQIVSPTGGVKDSLPPKLVGANPKLRSTNFKGNKITLDFDEYVELQDVRQNLLVSPSPKKDPNVDYKLRTVTIKLRDTLEPNTTYTINLGNAIRDLNEGNQLKNFTYVFSTGATLDSLEFTGHVEVAETGRIDSTLMIFLYKNLDDSAVIKQKPKYIARVDGQGNFAFKNLAGGQYKVYALKDGDGLKTYNSKGEMFAFSDSTINVNNNTHPVSLYAYVEETEKEKNNVTNNKNAEKKLKYTTSIPAETQDILTDLVIDFNKPLKNLDNKKVILTDTLFNVLPDVSISTDSLNKRIIIKNKWIENSDYKLIISKDFATDTSGNTISKADTIRFKTKKESNYGSIKMNFKNLDLKKNPVLQFVVSDNVVKSFPLTSSQFASKLFTPGDFELRILYDDNKNGKWDPGNYLLKRQPEKVQSISQKINIKADWENERDIEL